MKTLRSRVAAMLFIGFCCTYAASATPKPSPQEQRKTPATSATAGSEEQVSSEEKRKRKDWNDSMLRKPAPRKGCCKADYPSTEWREVACVAAPSFPAIPRHGPRPAVVGNSNDISAQAPSGIISQVIGHFENVTNVTSESGPIANNAYSLQINTNNFTSGVSRWQKSVEISPFRLDRCRERRRGRTDRKQSRRRPLRQDAGCDLYLPRSGS